MVNPLKIENLRTNINVFPNFQFSGDFLFGRFRMEILW